MLASGMLVAQNIWCVYIESLLNICMFLHIWLVFFIHIYTYPLLTQTLTSTWKESARQSQVGRGHLILQNKCFKQKVVVFLTFVTKNLIWNPKPDKDNTCTTINYHEGDTPLRNVCRSIVPPCFGIEYCVPFKNKTTILGISFT